ncbi:TMV resistance protein N-like [Punica granatum]|uniref:TMV resistance protein N-like n=1 Tax=Punica granatum TaxID=22663 RepID=A0A6P8CKT4_PUNGR|nr:TMV resistance protein N-like [Punica granatum]
MVITDKNTTRQCLQYFLLWNFNGTPTKANRRAQLHLHGMLTSEPEASGFPVMVTTHQRATSPSSSAFQRSKYDVFLSFRGEDVRNNFISHLRYALAQKEINTFIDDHLRRGEEISSELVEAIEGSRIAVVVFSWNFASSTWCLDELLKILECKYSNGQLVRPVFLHVSPSELRKGNGSYAGMLRRHEENTGVSAEKVHRWRAALHQAANLSGWHLGSGVESDLVRNIVEEVSSKLTRQYFIVASNPVGLESHIQAVSELLYTEVNDVRMVGISGISGVGKTTIAKALYNLIADQYEGSSFLENVSETSKQHGLMKLQEALLVDVLGDANVKVGYIKTGRHLVEDKLRNKRVLLVLDGVDQMDQLEDLTGIGQWVGSGSRIIVTTKDTEILRASGAENYNMKGLNHDDALTLFCRTAFQQVFPPGDYKLLSFCLANLTEGLPLLVVVLGSFLRGKTIQAWNQALRRLKGFPHTRIDEILRISFEDLEPHEKAIFLDIACFFNGENKDYAAKLLDRCNFYPDSGFKVLVEKSLITVESNKIWMHALLQDMGREIVHQESPGNPSGRSRLWNHEDVLQVLHGNSGTDAVEGIRLDMVDPEEIFMSIKVLRKMRRLRLIMVRNLHVSGCPEYLSSELSWLDLSHGMQDNDFGEEAAPFKKARFGRLIEKEYMGFREFTLAELHRATKNFSEQNLLGMSGFGSVYHGILDDGQEVAIKRGFVVNVRRGELNDHEFKTEVNILCRVNHKNIVRLLGFLEERNERALVYEFMSNYSLNHHLHIHRSSLLRTWTTRLQLALDAARGLEYLHFYAVPPLIHRDVKPTNILLDVNMRAKIADFGLSILTSEDGKLNSPVQDLGPPAVRPKHSCVTPIIGTVGYMDPQYIMNNQLTTKSDVYGFGVLLFELLSGRKAVYRDKQGSHCRLVDVVIPWVTQGDIGEFLDPNMPSIRPLEMEAVLDVAKLAADCNNFEAQERPSMAEVVLRLNSALERCLKDAQSD